MQRIEPKKDDGKQRKTVLLQEQQKKQPSRFTTNLKTAIMMGNDQNGGANEGKKRNSFIGSQRKGLINVLNNEIREQINPFQQLYAHESQIFNRLVQGVTRDLVRLRDSLRGVTLLTEEDEVLLENVTLNRVPEKWKALQGGESVKSLIAWASSLENKRLFMEKLASKYLKNLF